MILNTPNIPKDLSAGPVSLQFEKIVTPEPGAELVPYYHFKIRTPNNQRDKNWGNNVVGHINFRVGETRHIRIVAGHIGYEIHPKFRGYAYSYFACLALKPIINTHFKKVLLTVDPANLSSIKVIERIGAFYIDEIMVPEDDPAYINGARRKRRYSWII